MYKINSGYRTLTGIVAAGLLVAGCGSAQKEPEKPIVEKQTSSVRYMRPVGIERVIEWENARAQRLVREAVADKEKAGDPPMNEEQWTDYLRFVVNNDTSHPRDKDVIFISEEEAERAYTLEFNRARAKHLPNYAKSVPEKPAGGTPPTVQE